MKSRLQTGKALPPRKPLNEHKQSMSVTIEPEHREWVRNNFRQYGFRSESHVVDEAIRLLIEMKERERRTAART